eukprot:scaffold10173_cov281-Chaetoceros_neogracile.AAC.6
MQNDSRYGPLTTHCDQEDNKEKPTSTSTVMKKATNADKNDISWFCWENYGQDTIENRPHHPENQYNEHQQSNTVSTNDSSYIPNSGIHSEQQYYNWYPDVPCAGGAGSYYYNEHQYPPRQYRSNYANGVNDDWHSNPYKMIQNSYHRPHLYPHTSSDERKHGGGRTQSAPLYFHEDPYKNTPSAINTHCHHMTAPPPSSAIHSHQQQVQYQQHVMESRTVASSFRTPAFYTYPHPSNDDNGGNYNMYNKEFVDDQETQTSKKKRKSKPAAHEPRRPLSAYNFFFSEEKEFVVALLPDRQHTVTASEGQDASGTTITSASSSEDAVVKSEPLPAYDPKKISISAPPCDDTISTIPNQALLTQSRPASKQMHRRVSIDTISSSSSMLVVYDMDIDKIYDYLVDIERRTSAETLTALRHAVDIQTQQTLLVHLEGDRKKKSHKKSHGKISFQKLASIIGMRWRGLTDEGKNRYFELAKEDQARFRRQQNKQMKNVIVEEQRR